ncbi:MAG: acetyl-CoA carboxylase carboxyltransferase subunit beta [Candidatus Latescibacteria bacterium]|nr:acetyl-CoA carboxylase carboxyltransferase subunit beta [Candidatus Latescibacterota bacterium]NIM22329.1 acetyl-CoA carboxylase carboxyltransferase subunit beta [Candidatus Latescibacterota bacterium]NIM66158.1 acetyl-CoA carboxylase carboxyltransferase subunit beta [Candidatus Latescibacterota bacterium]NIO02566.1 acetyl-CoA carboxylase carboxyltransferase subunit beta [Candidatus Latescibacterota bacterium]NIO29480.1 acetyl-CoA carboxylase carboxyltransferase subunit beta [Candidatus Late
MSWFKRTKQSLRKTPKKTVPDGLWRKCDYCSEILYAKELEKKLWTCSKCGYHFLISTEQYIDIICDSGSFQEMHRGLRSGDPLGFKDLKRYGDRLKEYSKKTGKEEAVVTGFAKIGGRDVVLAVLDFSFMGGSMGSVVGEKVSRVIEDATEHRRPLIIVSRSGGARMQESIFSLMQMAKTSAMLAKMSDERVPYISILTNPTTGGVTASFASLGDVIIAEPKALIGFAGPRVIQQTIRQDLPEGFQRSEFLLEHGMIDMVVPRGNLRRTLEQLLEFLAAGLASTAAEAMKDEEQSPAVS